uniref:Glycosyltransferase 2-like domain-containing protein n=1 Tax=uncultured Bacillota bacterium TaxID=344338 RepID=A0A650ENC6_9FIRM|nr:hypothetical protein Firmicute1046_3360 [uncultured Firmicutes bacterium]
MNEILLTVGIPVYNVREDYLRACLDSVIKESSPRLEIIIVDDGSSDNSAHICQEYAKRDERIRFIGLVANRGVSFARNMMIDKAKGKWLLFLDADDILCNGFFEAVLKNNKMDADVMYYNYKIIGENDFPKVNSEYCLPIER